jgi:hypothetical protein
MKSKHSRSAEQSRFVVSRREVLKGLTGLGVGGGLARRATLTIISPRDKARIRGTVMVIATFTGDLNGGVIFWWTSLDGKISTSVGPELTAPPYEARLVTTDYPNGVYHLHALSHATGNTPDLTITVAN